MFSIVPVVEGEGEVRALPLLIRRILYERHQRFDIKVAKPKNGKGRSNLKKGLEKYIQYAAINPGCESILILLDSDDDCPQELAKSLVERCRQAGVGKPIAIVCATREYEAWFLASLETVKGNAGISESAAFEGNVEGIRGVKEWLGLQMPPRRAYKETIDQATLTDRIDLDLAHAKSRSFRRLCHAVEQLVEAMTRGDIIFTP